MLTTNTERDVQVRTPWYFSKPFVWTILFILGPFGIPLLVLSPRFNRFSKITISFLLLAVTILPLYIGSQVFEFLKSGSFHTLIDSLDPEQKKWIEQLLALLK